MPVIKSTMNKTIIGVLIGVLILGGLVWIARPVGQNTNSVTASSNTRLPDGQGSLVVEEPNNYDFGVISMAQGVVKHQFKVKNTGIV